MLTIQYLLHKIIFSWSFCVNKCVSCFTMQSHIHTKVYKYILRLTVALKWQKSAIFYLVILSKYFNFFPVFKICKIWPKKKLCRILWVFLKITLFSDFSSLWDAVNPHCCPEFRLDIQPHTIQYYQTREKMSLSIIIVFMCVCGQALYRQKPPHYYCFWFTEIY